MKNSRGLIKTLFLVVVLALTIPSVLISMFEIDIDSQIYKNFYSIGIVILLVGAFICFLRFKQKDPEENNDISKEKIGNLAPYENYNQKFNNPFLIRFAISSGVFLILMAYLAFLFSNSLFIWDALFIFVFMGIGYLFVSKLQPEIAHLTYFVLFVVAIIFLLGFHKLPFVVRKNLSNFIVNIQKQDLSSLEKNKRYIIERGTIEETSIHATSFFAYPYPIGIIERKEKEIYIEVCYKKICVTNEKKK